MTLTETVSLIQEYYKYKVKPEFVNRNLPKSRTRMYNLLTEINSNMKKLAPYHSAITFRIKAEDICDNLMENKFPSKTLIKEFEAYLAQTKLSTISENRG
jgi:hypothetical protein